MRIAETVTLPPGYEVIRREDFPALTPRENRGGGQSGEARIYFRTSGRSVAEVAHDFHTWFVTHGYSAATYSKARPFSCDLNSFSGAWMQNDHFLRAAYRAKGNPSQDNVVMVPYGFSRVERPDGTLERPVPDSPDCPT